MTRTRLAGLILCALSAASARADLTLSWNMNWKFAEGLPPQMTAAASQAALSPAGITIRYRDGRAAMEQGPIRAVADYDKGLITLFHPETKRVATAKVSDYPPNVAASLPGEAREVFQQMKLDVDSSRPGRFETIRGIKTEEFQIRMSLSMPLPNGAMEMKFLLSQWMPLADEVKRVPALRQSAELMAKAKGSIDPVAMMQKTFVAMPAAGEKFRAAFDEIMKTAGSGIGMRIRMTFIMPGLTKMAEQLKQKGIELPANFDGTLGHMTMELDRMDESPVPESAFAIPEGYQTVPMEELFKVMGKPDAHAH